MKRFLKNVCKALMCSAMVMSCMTGMAKEKVILDTDMVESFDDGVAMLMLAHSPEIELLGVTTVSGNSWVEQGTAYGLRQLELDGIKNVPLAAGMEYPFRPQRHADFEQEKAAYGLGYDLWLGSFGLEKPESWEGFYRAHYKEEPQMKPYNGHAVNFIIDTIRKNPNEVTIAAIGPCTNLAAAIRMAPDIVPLVKRIVYMGGSFYQHGNATPAAEFNWWFDPEATKICIRAPFKDQTILGLDVCEKVVFHKSDYDRLLKTMENSPQKDVLRSTFVGKSFEGTPGFTHFVWDVLVSAVIIDPTLITKSVDAYVDINDQVGSSYGQSLAYPLQAPGGTQKCHIVTEVDVERFWDMLNEKQYWPQR